MALRREGGRNRGWLCSTRVVSRYASDASSDERYAAIRGAPFPSASASAEAQSLSSAVSGRLETLAISTSVTGSDWRSTLVGSCSSRMQTVLALASRLTTAAAL
jgi:hypothetical protein